MYHSKVQAILDRIIALHPVDVVRGITMGEQESSIILARNVSPYILRFNNQIKPHYFTRYTQLGGTGGVIQQLISVIEKKISNEAIEQNRQTYQTALRALLDDTTAELWPSWLHAGSNAQIHGVAILDLLAFYWLAASDEDMVFAEAVAEEAKNDPAQRANLVQTSIENFIGLIAECRTAHNDPRISKDAPSCLPGTFGRIILRSSSFNKLTEVEAALFASIIPEIRNWIAEHIQSQPDATKIIIYRFISDKLIMGNANEIDSNRYQEFITGIPVKLTPIALLSRLVSTLPGLISSDEVNHELYELFKLELEVLKLDNELPTQYFIDQIRKITFNPIAVNQYKQITIHDDEIIQKRLDIFSLSLKLNALDIILDDEIMYALLVPGYLRSSKFQMTLERLNTIIADYVNKFAIISPQLEALLDARDAEFAKNNLEQEAIYEQAPANIQQELRRRNKLTNDILQVVKKKFDSLLAAYQNELLVLNSGNDDDDGIVLRSLPILNKYKSFQYASKCRSDMWAWNLMRAILNIYPKHSIENALPTLEQWVTTMMQTLDAEEINACIKTLNHLTTVLDLAAHKITAIIKILTQVFHQHGMTLNNIFESFTFEEIVQDFNRLFTQVGELSAWHELTEKKLCFFDENGVNPLQEEELSVWVSGLEILLCFSNNEQLIPAYVIMTFIKNLKLTEMKKSDANTLTWICQHYLQTGLESHFVVNQFTRDIHGLGAHLSSLLSTILPYADLFNAGYVRLMPAEATGPYLLEHQQNAIPGKDDNPIIFRVSNAMPNFLAFSYLVNNQKVSHKRLSAQNFCQHQYLYGHSVTKSTHTIQGNSYEFPRYTLNELKGYLQAWRYDPILSLTSLVDVLSEKYHNDRTHGYEEIVQTYVEAPTNNDNPYKQQAHLQSTRNGEVLNRLRQLVHTEENIHTFFQPATSSSSTAVLDTPSALQENSHDDPTIVYQALPNLPGKY